MVYITSSDGFHLDAFGAKSQGIEKLWIVPSIITIVAVIVALSLLLYKKHRKTHKLTVQKLVSFESLVLGIKS